MMRVSLLGFTVSASVLEDILRVDPNPPTQTNVFAWAITDSLISSGVEVTLISVRQVSNYPANPRLVFRGGKFCERGVQGYYLGFVNLLGVKHVTRFIQCLTRGTKSILTWRPDLLLVHGVHSPFLWYAALARKLFRVKIVALLTDPPGVVLGRDGGITRVLKALDIWLVKRALSSFDGVVALAPRLASDFAAGKPALVLEGINSNEEALEEAQERSDQVLLYAGGLVASNGVDRLVEAVLGLGEPPVVLAIFGDGDLKDHINEIARRRANIRPVAVLPRQEVLRSYRDADLLVQPRPVAQHFTPYSFPSKLLEYMASGTPVLSTHLPSIPEDYEPYLYWIDDDSIAGLRAAIGRVLSLPPRERSLKGRRAAAFVRETRSRYAQGRRLRAFLEAVLAQP
jgi:glycosyltransferase involved in cell wall biosynthesis